MAVPGRRVTTQATRAVVGLLRPACLTAAFVTTIAGCTTNKSHTSPSPTPSVSGAGTSAAGSSAPSSGSIHQVVPSKTVATAKPVKTDQIASFSHDVTVRIATLKNINTVARGPGEISGPGVVVGFLVKNGSATSIDLGSVTANLQDAAGIPSVSMVGAPADPFAGKVGPGKSATGSYVFSLPRSHRNPVTISISYTTAAPVVLFVGDVH
jgi:hypothetical protein